MDYIIEGIDPAPFAPLYGLSDAALAARGAVLMVADAVPGTALLLVNHASRQQPGPYHTTHAIFVTEGAIAPARFVNALPPVSNPRLLSLRGFDAGGMMVDVRLTQPGEAEAALLALLADERIAEVDVHNAVRGCFAARARRA
ncbi:MAG: DUF1203 domain-containing protein [Erythrobacter sp.]